MRGTRSGWPPAAATDSFLLHTLCMANSRTFFTLQSRAVSRRVWLLLLGILPPVGCLVPCLRSLRLRRVRMNIDTGRLIEEVAKRKCLWDISDEDYPNRSLKLKVWTKLTKKLIPAYERLDDFQKNSIGENHFFLFTPLICKFILYWYLHHNIQICQQGRSAMTTSPILLQIASQHLHTNRMYPVAVCTLLCLISLFSVVLPPRATSCIMRRL